MTEAVKQAEELSQIQRLTAEMVMKTIQDSSVDEEQKGARFEKLVKFFLENDPQWSSQLTHVWLWDDAPTHNGRDTGIDLVAQDDSGDYYAIQAKFYKPDKYLTYQTAATFFTAAVSGIYKHLILVNTGLMDRTLSDYADTFDATHSDQDLTVINRGDIGNSNLDWAGFLNGNTRSSHRQTQELRSYQKQAVANVLARFKSEPRTKLVMACGTGKTLTSLRIAEKQVPAGGSILYLAPSISLVAQTMRSWANQSNEKINVYVVCSDGKASVVEKGMSDEEILDTYGSLADVPAPATTSSFTLANRFCARSDALNVIFSTYQSIGVIHEAQKKGLKSFDLVICDEAHRTVGVIDPQNPFRQILEPDYVKASHRLFMTATPRVFSDDAKKKAGEVQAKVASMDDKKLYGDTAYTYTFGQAVHDGYLADYKVVVMCISPSMMGEDLQEKYAEANSEIHVDDAAKLVGVWKALSNRGKSTAIPGAGIEKSSPLEEGRDVLHRGIAFASSIRMSKILANEFGPVIEEYRKANPDNGADLKVDAQHVDGTMDSQVRTDKLSWLKDTTKTTECRILTNAQCLSEGIDVPSLDAVIYFSPKKSKVDIIQSVGRVMRKPQTGNKKYGYLIIPVVIPDGADENQILASSDYRTVWQVISALRSHDERLDAKINSAYLGQPDPLKGVVELDVVDPNKLAAQLRPKPHRTPMQRRAGKAENQSLIGTGEDNSEKHGKWNFAQLDIDYGSEELNKAIRARLVRRCGSNVYWASWTNSVARITDRQTTAIRKLIRSGKAKSAFDSYLNSMRRNLNPTYTTSEAVSVLAQHEVTKPIFENLFTNKTVVDNNPIVQGLDHVLDALREIPNNGLLDLSPDRSGVQNADQEELSELYQNVRIEAEQIKSDEARQNLVKEIYNQFFAKAFTDIAQSLGIVYTPVQVVDAQLHMVDRALRREFGTRLGATGVQILDGFAGTGTYITRLIEDSSLIPETTLLQKYEHELHADEIVPLAATIMDVNIEQSYHKRTGGDNYVPFPGALLTDTFQTYEASDQKQENVLFGDDTVFPENTRRTQELLKTPIRVFIGNPPYSSRDSKRTGSQNTKYKRLDKRIATTYASAAQGNNLNTLYDHYIRAFRWASDQVEKQGNGIICFITNGGWLEGATGAGIRRYFVKEFNSIYVYNLRGNQTQPGEESRREGGKIFGSGSRATIAITMLILNPKSHEHGVIHYHDIGDYLTRQKKLDILEQCVKQDPKWKILTQDKYGDWLNKRTSDFEKLAPLGVKVGSKKIPTGIFSIWSLGVTTDRDAWCYSFSKNELAKNMQKLISTYDSELDRWIADGLPYAKSNDRQQFNNYFIKNGSSMKWSSKLREEIKSSKRIIFNNDHTRKTIYRPFFKQWLYLDPLVNDRPGRQPILFPYQDANNLEICVAGAGSSIFSCLMVNTTPDIQFAQNGQCFPLYWYEKAKGALPSSVHSNAHGYICHDAITDRALHIFHETYKDPNITKEDIFYYIYGILHSKQYRDQFASNLQKELPRIPLAKSFITFEEAGRKLADLHVNYEKADRWHVQEEDGNGNLVAHVSNPGETIHMYYPVKEKDPKTGKKVPDKTVLQVSENMRIAGIPLRAYNYVVNRKSAIDWLIDRYRVSNDKQSGITNNPNQWSEDPRYIADLVEKVITVSMKTLDIIDSLPEIEEVPHPSDWPNDWNSSR